MQFPLLAFQMRRVRWTFENAKGFGCRPMTDGAADTEAWGRGPKASKEGNRGKWHAVVQRALWGFEHGRRGEGWQPAPLSGLVGDVAAHDGAAAGAGICLEP